MPKHTASSIRALLSDDTMIETPAYGWMKRGDYAAQRGVARIYASQLADEKAIEGTRHDNRIGFGHNYAKVGSLLGAWLDAGQKDGVMRRKVSGSFARSPWIHAANGHRRRAPRRASPRRRPSPARGPLRSGSAAAAAAC